MTNDLNSNDTPNTLPPTTPSHLDVWLATGPDDVWAIAADPATCSARAAEEIRRDSIQIREDDEEVRDAGTLDELIAERGEGTHLWRFQGPREVLVDIVHHGDGPQRSLEKLLGEPEPLKRPRVFLRPSESERGPGCYRWLGEDGGGVDLAIETDATGTAIADRRDVAVVAHPSSSLLGWQVTGEDWHDAPGWDDAKAAADARLLALGWRPAGSPSRATAALEGLIFHLRHALVAGVPVAAIREAVFEAIEEAIPACSPPRPSPKARAPTRCTPSPS